VREIKDYETIFFDCDGVLLDSNQSKAQAYFKVVSDKYGEDAATELVNYHYSNPSFNRFQVFEYFLQDIINVSFDKYGIKQLAKSYGDVCREEIVDAEETENVRDFLSSIKVPKFVVTGNLEDDARYVLEKKGLSSYFDGIYGSPNQKHGIIFDLFLKEKAKRPSLFIGDSDYDYHSAFHCGIDFVFMSQYSGFFDYISFFADKNIVIIRNLLDLL